jgi:uncharacterized protein
MLIIDCHCHAGKGDGLTGPWDTDAPLKEFMNWSTEAKIQKTVLFSAFHSDYSFANEQVAKIVAQNPERFYGFAFVHAARDNGRIGKMVEKAVQEYGFCGIKAHRFDARISREICDTARLFNIPVLYDVVGEISVVELLATQYPDVNFIIPHLGSFSDDWRAQAGMIDYLVRFPNIYADTSGVRRFDILKKAFERAGTSKILFGTDGPWLHPGVELSKIFALHLPEKGLQQVLAGNLLKLISKVKKQQIAPINSNNLLPNDAQISQEWRDPWLINEKRYANF